MELITFTILTVTTYVFVYLTSLRFAPEFRNILLKISEAIPSFEGEHRDAKCSAFCVSLLFYVFLILHLVFG